MAQKEIGLLAVKLKQAAEILGVSESSVRRKIASGEIHVCRKFRHVLIDVDELRRFIGRDTRE